VEKSIKIFFNLLIFRDLLFGSTWILPSAEEAAPTMESSQNPAEGAGPTMESSQKPSDGRDRFGVKPWPDEDNSVGLFKSSNYYKNVYDNSFKPFLKIKKIYSFIGAKMLKNFCQKLYVNNNSFQPFELKKDLEESLLKIIEEEDDAMTESTLVPDEEMLSLFEEVPTGVKKVFLLLKEFP
jgi:hypothetical protein